MHGGFGHFLGFLTIYKRNKSINYVEYYTNVLNPPYRNPAILSVITFQNEINIFTSFYWLYVFYVLRYLAIQPKLRS